MRKCSSWWDGSAVGRSQPQLEEGTVGLSGVLWRPLEGVGEPDAILGDRALAVAQDSQVFSAVRVSPETERDRVSAAVSGGEGWCRKCICHHLVAAVVVGVLFAARQHGEREQGDCEPHDVVSLDLVILPLAPLAWDLEEAVSELASRRVDHAAQATVLRKGGAAPSELVQLPWRFLVLRRVLDGVDADVAIADDGLVRGVLHQQTVDDVPVGRTVGRGRVHRHRLTVER